MHGRVIPLPNKIEEQEGAWSVPKVIGCKNNVGFSDDTLRCLEKWGHELAGFEWNWSGSNVKLNVDDSLPVEGYRLEIESTGVKITGKDAEGCFRGLTSLVQLIADGNGTIPCQTLTDSPRFGHRGMHQDVSRHMFPVKVIKQLLDAYALAKMNRFHWHLTDDQGWRIEIKRYPDLTRIGSVRRRTLRTFNPRTYDEHPHSGFFTQDEIREIVAYAKARFIEVLPEIDLPGHMTAALAAYPEYGRGPEFRPEVGTDWGVMETVLHPRPATVEFLKNILTEIAELFPFEWVHIGGDECPATEWKASAEMQAQIKELGLKNEAELQSWLNHQLGEHLATLGKRVIGWDEIIDGGLSPGTVVMSWRGMDPGKRAAEMGHDVVMAPYSHTYFDFYDGLWKGDDCHAIGGYIPIEKVYKFEPIPAGLSPDKHKHILGGQGQLWTEYMPSSTILFRRAFPRAMALAEVLWTEKPRLNYIDFCKRMATFDHFLKNLGIVGNTLFPAAPPRHEWVIEAGAQEVKWTSNKRLSAGRFAVRVDLEFGSGLRGMTCLARTPEGEADQDLRPLGVGGSGEAYWYDLELKEAASGVEITLRLPQSAPKRLGGALRFGPVTGRPPWCKEAGFIEIWQMSAKA